MTKNNDYNIAHLVLPSVETNVCDLIPGIQNMSQPEWDTFLRSIDEVPVLQVGRLKTGLCFKCMKILGQAQALRNTSIRTLEPGTSLNIPAIARLDLDQAVKRAISFEGEDD